ncbi:hypothetical protein BGW42_003067 [Actinomortierella wolfii]|nr:hypothetical protein BGW42_003067 [Actinomortierella wolfii]
MKSLAYFPAAAIMVLVGASMSMAFPWIPGAIEPLPDTPGANGIDYLPDSEPTTAGPLAIGIENDGMPFLGSEVVDLMAETTDSSTAGPVVQVPSAKLGHEVLIQPETNVLPISRLQPIVNIARPIIQVDPFYAGLAADIGYGGLDFLGRNYRLGANAEILPFYYEGAVGGEDLILTEGPLMKKRQLSDSAIESLRRGSAGAYGGPMNIDAASPIGGSGPLPAVPGSSRPDDGLTSETVIQPIVNIEAYTPASIPVANPIPYQYPVPYSVGVPYPIRTSD